MGSGGEFKLDKAICIPVSHAAARFWVNRSLEFKSSRRKVRLRILGRAQKAGQASPSHSNSFTELCK